MLRLQCSTSVVVIYLSTLEIKFRYMSLAQMDFMDTKMLEVCN